VKDVLGLPLFTVAHEQRSSFKSSAIAFDGTQTIHLPTESICHLSSQQYIVLIVPTALFV
jgi:hypothetical protein